MSKVAEVIQDMTVVVDVGNTSIAFGWFVGKELRSEHHLSTQEQRTSDEYEALLALLLQRRFGCLPKVSRIVMCSVVPSISASLGEALQSLWGIAPLVVGPGVKTGVPLRVQEPHSLGADRVVNALAARELFGAPSVVVDCGTAIAFDVVGPDGAYEGGVIAPGPQVALEALVARAAKLPLVECERPKQVIGKTTAGAMQSGVVIGYGYLIDGIVEAIQRELCPLKYVICTGSGARCVAEAATRITHVEPSLTLQGLRLIAELNP